MPTLEEVEVAFLEWRASKKKKYERIPQTLIEMAGALVGEHGVIAVCKRLKIPPRKFLPKEVAPFGEFIEVPRPAPGHLPSVIIINVKLSAKREVTVTMPAGNLEAVSELLKKVSRL